MKLAIKLPDEPRALNLTDPYPDLLDDGIRRPGSGAGRSRRRDEVPEVERAIEIAEQYHSPTGTLTFAETPEAPAAMAPPVAGS